MRYPHHEEDGLPPGEGAFGLSSFWDIAYLAQAGRIDAAEAELEEMLSYSNDVGLYGEEIQPETGDTLGNFPQAFTHVGLINAVLAVAEAKGERVRRAPEEI